MADAETDAPMRALHFVHSPLPDPETHIRLLEVQQGDSEQHVVCAMSVWPLESAPPYSAISYTWGDPALTTSITIDGRTMVVRQNGEYALQQTFAIEKKKKYVWVDAVCIDQTNVEERGHQVAIMGQLYRRAAQVFACVGLHADDSEFLQIMSRKKAFFGRYYVGCPLETMGHRAMVSTPRSPAWNEMSSQYDQVNGSQTKEGFGGLPQ